MFPRPKVSLKTLPTDAYFIKNIQMTAHTQKCTFGRCKVPRVQRDARINVGNSSIKYTNVIQRRYCNIYPFLICLYCVLEILARFSSAFASRTLNRHASFTPVDTRFNATSAAVAHTLPRAPTHAAPSQPPPPPPRPLQPPPPPFSLSSAYNPQPLRAPIATAVELSSSPTTSTTTLQQSYRSAFTAKCRRSSSLMSRYKPKLLRFAPDSACVLNIYVADANSSSARADPTQKGILKNAARPSPPLQQSRDQTRHSRSPTMRQRASDARSRSHGPIGAANDNDDGDNDHDEFELESLEVSRTFLIENVRFHSSRFT